MPLSLFSNQKVRRQSFTVAEKLRVISYAEDHGNRQAEREYGASECSVRAWRKSKAKLLAMPRNKRADRRSKPFFSDLEQKCFLFCL